jgi:hypothetical protein
MEQAFPCLEFGRDGTNGSEPCLSVGYEEALFQSGLSETDFQDSYVTVAKLKSPAPSIYAVFHMITVSDSRVLGENSGFFMYVWK